MNYWLTLHGIHKAEFLISHKNLYMQDRYLAKAEEVSVGDKVAFYRGKSGEAGGYVDYLGVVVGERSPNIFPGGQFDENGIPKWKWYWPIGNHQSGHFASRAALFEILSLNGLRIAGGLLKLSREQFTLIAATVPSQFALPDDIAAEEWREKIRLHRLRERSRRLVILKKLEALETHGELRCEACRLVFSEFYGVEYIECHHTIPVAMLVQGQATRLADLRLVCANCHRVIHLKNTTVEELKICIERRRD